MLILSPSLCPQAARNCLVNDQGIVKVSDFGLSRSVCIQMPVSFPFKLPFQLLPSHLFSTHLSSSFFSVFSLVLYLLLWSLQPIHLSYVFCSSFTLAPQSPFLLLFPRWSYFSLSSPLLFCPLQSKSPYTPSHVSSLSLLPFFPSLAYPIAFQTGLGKADMAE